jgi:hypothetical protein
LRVPALACAPPDTAANFPAGLLHSSAVAAVAAAYLQHPGAAGHPAHAFMQHHAKPPDHHPFFLPTAGQSALTFLKCLIMLGAVV